MDNYQPTYTHTPPITKAAKKVIAALSGDEDEKKQAKVELGWDEEETG